MTADTQTEEKPPRGEPPNDKPGKSGSLGEPKPEPGRASLWRRHPSWIVAGGVGFLVLAAVGYVFWLAYLHPYESTDDAFVDARSFAVAPKVSGYVVDVPVTDNQRVEVGQVLLRIDQRDYEVALAQAKAQVQSGHASIENIDAQLAAQQSVIEEAQEQVNQTQAALKFAQDDARRYQELARTGSGTVQRSQQSTSNLQQRQADTASAKAALDAAQQQVGSLKAQRSSAVATLARYQAERDQADLNLGYTTVTAAQAGRVANLTGSKGQYLQIGQSISMFVPSTIWVTANFKETQLTDMRPGQPAQIEIDAYPDRKITGRVDSVQPGSGTVFSVLPAQNATGNYVKVVQRVPVKIAVDNWPTDVTIGPGMSIVPTVQVRPRPAYLQRLAGG